ncbi:hypothetical protein P879_03539 [Paragonimus westermani]|uniref:RZZ complex subunit KNTC1/ROD C-terminal domain-containing protein n=1 Tax=Paragonimus westermani TaxID=34504 RepID=A0A8T0DP90_9TREM|nr:hypothetical protein P879_03539 [Paragonimus westermani]
MPEIYEVVKYLEVCSSEQPSLLKAVSSRFLNVLSLGRKILILDSNYAIVSSVTHCECVTDVALTPDASILLFTDTRGTLSIYFPSESHGVFSLVIVVSAHVSDSCGTDKFALLLAAERLMYWLNLESFLLKSALVNQDSECLFSLLRGAINCPDSDGSYSVFIYHTALNWTLQLSAPVPVLYALSTGLVLSEPVFTPFDCSASDQIVFSKAFFINPVYCVALSTTGRLYLFNLVAVLCLGILDQFPQLIDFCVCIPETDQVQYSPNEEYPGLPPFRLVFLRKPNENDPPSANPELDWSQNILLEVVAFPSGDVLHQLIVGPQTWLLSAENSGGLANKNRPFTDCVLFAELTSNTVDKDSQLISIKALQTINPEQRIRRLLKEHRFDEARHVLAEFNLKSVLCQEVALIQLRWYLSNGFATSAQSSAENKQDHFRAPSAEQGYQLLVCLREIEEIWLHVDLLSQLLDVTMPTSNLQMDLLLLLKEKLCSSSRTQNLPPEEQISQVFKRLKRLKTFLLLYGANRFSVLAWTGFMHTDIYVMFIRLLVNSNDCGPHCNDTSVPSDPSKAFLVWDLYKGELLDLLTSANLERLCNLLAQRPLTYTVEDCKSKSDYRRNFVAAETILYRWLRSELLPAVVRKCPDALSVIVQFVVQRISQLESCWSRCSSVAHTVSQSSSSEICPFDWPASALSWADALLTAASVDTSELLFPTIGDQVDRFMSGLASLDPEVDPMVSLRRLAKQLQTIDSLYRVYGLRLSLNCFDEEDELSIAYRILDIAFNSGIPFVDGIDPTTARYLKDRRVDLQAFYLGYTLDLISKVQAIVHLPTQDGSLIEQWHQQSPQLRLPVTRTMLFGKDLHTILQQVCLVAGWIELPLCRLRVVAKLASVLPPPWPTELFRLADETLAHARQNGLIPEPLSDPAKRSHRSTNSIRVRELFRLQRLTSVARVQAILLRYNIEDFQLIGTCYENSSELAQLAICRMIMTNTEGGARSYTDLESTTVIEDASFVARELLNRPDWRIWFSRLHMVLALELALFADSEENSAMVDVDNRVAFVLSQLDVIVKNCLADSMDICRVIKHYLSAVALQWIDIALESRQCLTSSQSLFLETLGICVAQLITLEFNSPEHVPKTIDSMRLYRWLHSRDLSLLHSDRRVSMPVRSSRWLLSASLNERVFVASFLADWFLGQQPTATITTLLDIPVMMKPLYRLCLPELSMNVREDLLAWNWYSSVLKVIVNCAELSDSPNRLMQLEAVLRTLVASVVHRPGCFEELKAQRSHTQLVVSSHQQSQPGGSLFACTSCTVCSTLWSTSLGCGGALLQLWCNHIFPQLLTSLDDASDNRWLQSWLRVVISCFEHLVELWHWAGRPQPAEHLTVTGITSCAFSSQAATLQFEGLRETILAYVAHLRVLMHALSNLQSPSTSVESDILANWTFTPMFLETGKAVPIDSIVKSLRCSLSWFSRLFSWLIGRNTDLVRQPAASETYNSSAKIVEPSLRGVVLKALLMEATEITSSWAIDFGQPLTASLPFCFGINRLVSHRSHVSLWTHDPEAVVENPCEGVHDTTDFSSVFRKWYNLCNHWTLAAFEAVLQPVDGGYLDQPLALSLALACPTDEATCLVHKLVSTSRNAPKKMKALTNLVYAFSLVAPRRASNLRELSQSMAKTWFWRVSLKPHGLNVSSVASFAEPSPLQAALDKLCRIVPSPTQPSPPSPPMGVLLPSARQANNPFAKSDLSSAKPRPLPSLQLITLFAQDFNLSLKHSLLHHLKALFAPGMDIFSLVTPFNQRPSFEPVPPNGDDASWLSVVSQNVDVRTYRLYQQVFLRRAHHVLKRLVPMYSDSTSTELVTLLNSFVMATSPYDYERLHFLFTWISLCEPLAVDTQNFKLLRLLGSYTRSCQPSDYECECVSTKSGDEELAFTNADLQHPLSRLRMPFHMLLKRRPPMDIIGPEVTANTVTFWLQVNNLMEWKISDSLRLMAASNLVDQFSRARLLPLISAKKTYGETVTSTSAGWDRGLLCQNITSTVFKTLRELLLTVTNQTKVLQFLGGLSRRVIYGPHGLAVLEIARDLAENWLRLADEQARLVYATEHSGLLDRQLSCPNQDPEEDVEAEDLVSQSEIGEHVNWCREALQKADARHRQLAMEACLHQNHLAHWEEVYQHLQDPVKLMTALLLKVASSDLVDIADPTISDSKLPVWSQSLRQRLIRTLPRLAELARVDLREFGCRLLMSKLQLPSHILSINGSSDTDANLSNQSFLIDASLRPNGLHASDVTLDTTMACGDIGLSAFNNQSSEQHAPPSEEDFVLGEILLRIPVVREELLPYLHSFVFTGDMNAYPVSRWCIARCILRSQLSFVLWPRLSMEELRAVLLRLALLASCSVPAHQRMLLEVSETRISQNETAFTSIQRDRIHTCVQRLLSAEEDKRSNATELAGQLVIEFDLTDSHIIAKLLTLLVTNSLSSPRLLYLLRFFEHISSASPWRSFAWLWSDTFDVRLLPDLIRQLISAALTAPHATNRAHLGELLSSRILTILRSWPFPDEQFESAMAFAASQLFTPMQRLGCSASGGHVLVTSLLNLLASTSCLKPNSVNAFRESIKTVYNDSETGQLTDALEASEVYLTASCFQTAE